MKAQPAPIIASFFPTSANTGTVITIRGNNLANTTAVSFGGIPASSFQVLTDTTFYISAVVANGATGVVSVTTNGGTGTKSGFTFLAGNIPTVSSFLPISGGTGTVVKIRGTNFTGVSAVSFGDIPASSFQVLTDTTQYISAVVAAGATGSVKVTNAAGSGLKTGFTFNFTAPVITSFFPVSGSPGTQVFIQGKNLSGILNVSFGGTNASSFTLLMDTAMYISAIVGNGSTGKISVSKASGTGTSADNFTVNLPVNDTLTLCPNSNSSLVSSASGNSYQWQIFSDTGFASISNFGPFSGTTSQTLQFTNITDIYNGYRFRCLVNNAYVSKQTTLQFANTFTGIQSNVWENAANWSCGLVPGPLSAVVITGNATINNSTIVKSLIVKPGAAITIANGANIDITGK
ncbi:MAG: IPT/TIG domain-containing protein [Bacteroidota bacterium]